MIITEYKKSENKLLQKKFSFSGHSQEDLSTNKIALNFSNIKSIVSNSESRCLGCWRQFLKNVIVPMV